VQKRVDEHDRYAEAIEQVVQARHDFSLGRQRCPFNDAASVFHCKRHH
jgi:hypothetical protein